MPRWGARQEPRALDWPPRCQFHVVYGVVCVVVYVHHTHTHDGLVWVVPSGRVPVVPGVCCGCDRHAYLHHIPSTRPHPHICASYFVRRLVAAMLGVCILLHIGIYTRVGLSKVYVSIHPSAYLPTLGIPIPFHTTITTQHHSTTAPPCARETSECTTCSRANETRRPHRENDGFTIHQTSDRRIDTRL